jgi:hypothetical protein
LLVITVGLILSKQQDSQLVLQRLAFANVLCKMIYE